MKISTEDRSAFLRERVVIHAIHNDEFGVRMYATGPGEQRTKQVIADRLGAEIEVTVCGHVPREVRPRSCSYARERDPRRLLLLYDTQGDEHVNDVIVAEDDAQVVIYGTLCAPIELAPGDESDSRYHAYLDKPLGGRMVIDAVSGRPVS
ncbi:hypothetical protein OJ998_12070 [Solirubrobacter taibaiensis]|nr:hypothetical protein [Solirubrobacter taibaiensis]